MAPVRLCVRGLGHIRRMRATPDDRARGWHTIGAAARLLGSNPAITPASGGEIVIWIHVVAELVLRDCPGLLAPPDPGAPPLPGPIADLMAGLSLRPDADALVARPWGRFEVSRLDGAEHPVAVSDHEADCEWIDQEMFRSAILAGPIPNPFADLDPAAQEVRVDCGPFRRSPIPGARAAREKGDGWIAQARTVGWPRLEMVVLLCTDGLVVSARDRDRPGEHRAMRLTYVGFPERDRRRAGLEGACARTLRPDLAPVGWAA